MLRLMGLLLVGLSAYAQSSVVELLESKTVAELQRFDGSFDGVLGVAVIDLQTGRRFSVHGDSVFPQASVIKIPILVRMFQAERTGQFHFSDRITLTAKDAVGGSGFLQDRLQHGPVTLSLRELVDAMIQASDNTATNQCIQMLGMDRVNHMLDELGFPKTRLRRRMMDREAVERNDENVSTPDEMARLVEQIYRGKAVDAEASREILEIMKKVAGGIREGLPLDIPTAVKTGEVPGIRNETGVVFLPGAAVRPEHHVHFH